MYRYRRILDHLDTDEARALSEFLVEVLGLEEAIRNALVTFYAAPGRGQVFERSFLDRMTLGALVQRLGPVLDHLEVQPLRREMLREVVEMRNVVAHNLPIAVGEDEDIEQFRVYQTRNGPVRVTELDSYTLSAVALRALLSYPWGER